MPTNLGIPGHHPLPLHFATCTDGTRFMDVGMGPPVVFASNTFGDVHNYRNRGVARRSAPETHKRMMLMPTVYIVAPATRRMRFLPSTGLGDAESYDFVPVVYSLCLMLPAFLHDVLRRGRLHRAYVHGLAVLTASVVLTRLLWDWPWWHRIVSSLMLAGE